MADIQLPVSSRLSVLTATIANGESLSDALDLKGYGLTGFQMPTSWTTANLTFQVSVDGTTYQNLYDDLGNEVTVTAAASRFIRVDPALFVGFEKIKVRSGTSGSAVNQAAARSIVVQGRVF